MQPDLVQRDVYKLYDIPRHGGELTQAADHAVDNRTTTTIPLVRTQTDRQCQTDTTADDASLQQQKNGLAVTTDSADDAFQTGKMSAGVSTLATVAAIAAASFLSKTLQIGDIKRRNSSSLSKGNAVGSKSPKTEQKNMQGMQMAQWNENSQVNHSIIVVL